MGIPSYFSHIIRNYPNILRNLGFFVNQPTFAFRHLFMDCNSIVYDAVHSIHKEETPPANMEQEIIDRVIVNIKNYIGQIRPTETVYIAFDGVAPFAKMEQQRTRRYKTRFMANISNDDASSPRWNTSAITPGTEFMEKLSYQIDYAFKNKEVEFKVKRINVSCSNKEGEGEHKLFAYMRKNNVSEDNVAVYGLDADLIMLSIFHLQYCKNIYVFRETPEFLKSSIPIETRGVNNEPHFLDIQHLSNSILSEMGCSANDKQRIFDYAFMCFFLGNDFLPHFPAMNIRTHGIGAMLDIYRMYIGAHPDRFFISKTTGNIQWKNVGIFVTEIAKREHEFLMNEYFVRSKFDKRHWPEKTDVDKEDLLLNTPIIYRQQEKYICPEESHWEQRYYKTLFHMEKTPDNTKKVCLNYMEGLEWVFKYYTQDCPHWRWKYNYHYPPLFSDLCKYIPHFETGYIENNAALSSFQNRPFLPQTQLAYVLPSANLDMLPKKIHAFLKTNYCELYPDNYEFQWAFCRYLWESHPLLPDIPLELLEQWDIQFRMHCA